MQYLLDTHTFIWFSENDNRLSKKVAKIIVDIENDCFISIASLWEIAIKSQNGKLELEIGFSKVYDFLYENNISNLPVELENLYALLNLEFIHRDPFDRILISQAIADDLTILTTDKNIPKYPVKCLW